MAQNTAGGYNTAVGNGALVSNTTGNYNTASGQSSLSNNTTGNENTASGSYALMYNTTGQANTGLGYFALLFNAEGNNNTAIGHGAAVKQKGSNNTSVGSGAGYGGDLNDGRYQTGNNNIALGYQAGSNWSAGSNNVAIASRGSLSDANTIRLGTQGTQTKTFIAGILGASITRGSPVVISRDGQLGMIASSRRFKEDIQPMGDASDALMKLRPVTFRYKQPDADGQKPLQYGLIA